MSLALSGLALSVLTCAAFAAEHWSQFRGPNGAGISETGAPPVSFGPDQNLRWKSPAPAGVSSPVVWGDRIFLTGVDDKKLLTLAYDATSGRELWRQIAPAEKLEATHPFSSPAASTPCTDGRLVFAYFNSFGVLAYDFNGKEVWRRPLPTLRTQYGSASSPVIVGGKLIVQRDGGTADSHLLALDPATGKTVWDSPRALARDGHATPMLWRHDGKEELMVQGRGSLMAYDPATGESKWWVQGWGMAAIATPVAGDGMLFGGSTSGGDPSEPPPPELNWDRLIAAHDANKDGALSLTEVPTTEVWQIRKDVSIETAGNSFPIRTLLKVYVDANKDGVATKEEWEAMGASMNDRKNSDRFVAVRPGARENATDSHVVWETTKGLNEMTSPLFYRGLVYILADGGRLSVFRPATGERVLDRQPIGLGGQYVASPIAANGLIYVVNETGTVGVLRAGEKIDLVAKNLLSESVRSTPAIAGGKLIIRTGGHLWAFGG